MSDISPIRVEVPFAVKTYDVDFAGIVSNIVYIRWLEDLRLRMLEEYYPLAQAVAAGIGPALLRTHIEYKRPLRMFDRPLGRMWMSELGRAKGVLQAEFHLDGQVTTAAEQVYCFVNLKTLRAVPQPDEIRRRFLAARQSSQEDR
jgi:acyl-CoA thioester hydrolase